MKKWKWIVSAAVLLLAAAWALAFFRPGRSAGPEKTLTIGIPASDFIQDIDTNRFKLWLEEQTGLHLEFCLLPDGSTGDYLDRMFAYGNLSVDVIFSFPTASPESTAAEALLPYGQKGYVIPLNQWVDASPFMRQLFSTFAEYDLRKTMTSPDGGIYSMPGLDTSTKARFSQIMWINRAWLEALDLEIPRTIDELEVVLQAFSEMDPNGNGKRDEVALAGCSERQSEQACNFLVNAWVYNDPENARMLVEDGIVRFAPASGAWREAMIRLSDLYGKGLLDSFQFTLDHRGLVQLANDPRDLLGAFTSASLADVVLQDSPDRISRYVRVPPLTGPDGKAFATVRTPLPRAGGVITSSCRDPAAAYRLLECMLSHDAFLFGRFGEEGVDWEPAQTGDISVYGNPARIRVKSQLWNKVQNKHLLELGPYLTDSAYADGVAWNGVQADQAYMDARAYALYAAYVPQAHIRALVFPPGEHAVLASRRTRMDGYVNERMAAFVKGKSDPSDEVQWQAYLDRLSALGMDSLTKAAQAAYDAQRNPEGRRSEP